MKHRQSDTENGEVLKGARIWRGWLDAVAQRDLVAELREVMRLAPPFSPQTRWGKPMSVAMTSAGRYGWYSDRRRLSLHPPAPVRAGLAAVPPTALHVWRAMVSADRDPDCCLVNHYRDKARMGLHQDRDEADFSWPVLSISLGDPGLFRMGGTERGGRTVSTWLESGDVLMLAGPARLAYHGIDRIRFGESDVVDGGGRINLTMRVVD